jgi:hypothetical protein
MARTRGLKNKRRMVAAGDNIHVDSLNVQADHAEVPHENVESETQHTAFVELNGRAGDHLGESQNMQLDETHLNTQYALQRGAERPADPTSAHASSSIGARKYYFVVSFSHTMVAVFLTFNKNCGLLDR